MHKYCSMFHNFTGDQQFTSWKFLELAISNDDNNSSRNQNVFNDDDTVIKSTQNSLPWVLPDKYITDWLTIQLILSLIALFSLFLPSRNIPLFKKCNVLFSLVINNLPMNRFPISNSTYVQSSCVKYIPLLCQIWPIFKQKSSLFYQQSLGMLQTHVQNTQFSTFCRQSSAHSSDNYIHCSAKLSVFIPLFTIHHNQLFPPN